MNIVLFYHSLRSDWNHGNAHFLRGIASELMSRGDTVRIYEPENNWSLTNLLQDGGAVAAAGFRAYYPLLDSTFYDPAAANLEHMLADADLVIVHEWNDHNLVRAIGQLRARSDFRLLFHDTHHRAATESANMAAYDLAHYDGVLAYGNVIRDIYLREGWARRAWTWHEAADTRVFYPHAASGYAGDVVWIGNWGDEERTRELFTYLIEPVQELGLKAAIYGVRYPAFAQKALQDAGITYGGWLPNYKAPEVFARYRMTVHVPRRPYVEALPGIPTIRPFEALACGIPLIAAPWNDSEHLFSPGADYLLAHDKESMKLQMQRVLQEPGLASQLAQQGLHTIRSKHTCAHRVDELYRICREIGLAHLTQQTLVS